MCQCKSSCGCGCQSSKSCCSEQECGKNQSCGCSSCKSSCGEGSGGFAHKFLELADQAWKEVLKEKIKKHIEVESKNLDELAKLISDANHERWKKKMESSHCCGCFEEKLENFFNQSCQTKH